LVLEKNYKGVTHLNERIREIRNTLGLTQNDFGNKLGVARNTIANYETGNRVPSNQIIISICREFNINEDWFRNGQGEMFNNTETFSLDELVKQQGMDDLELDIMKCYFELDKNTRQAILQHIKKYFNKKDNVSSGTIAEMSLTNDYSFDSVAEAEEKYKKNVLENVRKTEHIALSTIEEQTKKSM